MTSNTDLEQRLVELGDHLDLPDGDELIERVRAALAQPRSGTRELPAWLRVAAALVVAVLVALAAFAPSREAIASWLGIGAVELRNSTTGSSAPPGSAPVPGASSGLPATFDLAALRARVGFPVVLPSDPDAGAPIAAEVDDRVAGGLIAVSYPTFTLVEVASTGAPVVGKSLGPESRMEAVDVGGRSGYWITGAPHDIAYIDRNGEFVLDTVRQAGNVLLWEADGVTYRLEGLADRDTALRIAESMS